jgi:hypothetical protein
MNVLCEHHTAQADAASFCSELSAQGDIFTRTYSQLLSADRRGWHVAPSSCYPHYLRELFGLLNCRQLVEAKGFRRWCVTLRMTGFIDFAK